MKKIIVSLGERTYPIFIGENILGSIGRQIRPLLPSDRAIIISDSTVYELFGAKLSASLIDIGVKPLKVIIPSGETSKSMEFVTEIYRELAKNSIERNDSIFALGGGIIGDIAGFVASTYLRGLPFIQVPTTLLAQVDSSIGGKVGINFNKWKNLVGSFYQPKAVVIDVDVIAGLPEMEKSNGLAEMIKTAFISSDYLVSFLESRKDNLLNLDSSSMVLLVEECCRFKSNIVEQDEKESSLRRILNYGHTMGHAIESSTDLRWTHGQAVAAGMVFAAVMAYRLGLGPADIVKRLVNILKAANLPTILPPLKMSDVMSAISHDKKRIGGNIPYVILQSPGKTRIVEVDENTIEDTVKEFPKLFSEAMKQ